MRKRQIIGTLLLLLLVCTANGQGGGVRVLHYNLLNSRETSANEYRMQKERDIAEVLADNKVTIYSILEGGCRNCFVPENVFVGHSDYKLQKATTASLRHTLYYNKEKVTVLQTQSYASEKALFFYHRLQLAGVKMPVHLLVYEQSVSEHPVNQYQEILNFINSKNIKGQLLLLGGSPSPIQTSREGYFRPSKTNLELINTETLFQLYDDSNKFVWHNEVDFVYISKDVWLQEVGEITYERISQSLYKGEILEDAENKNRPFVFRLKIRGEAQQRVYETPNAEIILQDKKQLVFSITWDEDVMLNVEVVSMIGNKFFSQNVRYQGFVKEYKVALDDYPTGIYLLKIGNEYGRTIFRKFTKY